MSFRKIVGQLNCHLSNAQKICNQFVSRGSIETKARTGCSIKISEKVARIAFCAVKELRFGTLKANLNEARLSDVCRTATKYIIRKIVHRHVSKP